MAPGAGFEPARAPWPTGSQGQVTIEGSRTDNKKLPPDHFGLLKYLPNTNNLRGALVRIIVESNKVTLEFNSPDDVQKFLNFIQTLGVTSNIIRKEIRIEYDEGFWDYLTKDRGIDKRTAKSYMNYLKKLSGQNIDYNLYLKILDNKWKVKLVRVYLDYLYKTGKISWEELQKLKDIFKVKKNNNGDDEYPLDVDNLLDKYLSIREESLYHLLLEILLYSGIRLSEAVKMIKEWNNSRLTCFENFCRYKLKWLRGRKRCDYIYFPKHLLKKILLYIHRIGKYENIRKNIYEYYNIKGKDFRKLHYRLCRRVLDKEICDFYQSRISNLTIGDIHYDNLLSRADENYSKLLEHINNFIKQLKEELYVGHTINVVKVIELSDDTFEKNKKEYTFSIGDILGQT